MQCINAGRRVKVDMLAVAVPNTRGFTPAKDKHMLSFMEKGGFVWTMLNETDTSEQV